MAQKSFIPENVTPRTRLLVGAQTERRRGWDLLAAVCPRASFLTTITPNQHPLIFRKHWCVLWNAFVSLLGLQANTTQAVAMLSVPVCSLLWPRACTFIPHTIRLLPFNIYACGPCDRPVRETIGWSTSQCASKSVLPPTQRDQWNELKKMFFPRTQNQQESQIFCG